jgi:UDP-N-acetylglucosamine--N-acetylmuramyl-(pentapeptide) pyrophosphoryl-undecaprenol N-acetylglucosamine transferase
MVGFPEAKRYYENYKRVEVTGTPVRREFFTLDRAQARLALGLADAQPLVVSFWGSQGAGHMSERTVELVERWAAEGRRFHYVHGAGRDYEDMTAELARRDIRVTGDEVRPYIDDMPTVMAAADLVICRAGASTLGELTALGKPAILVPSPFVAANHQYKNAKVLADRGGAVLLEEKDCTGAGLYDTAMELLADGARRAAMGRALKELAAPRAAEDIYQALTSILKT